MVKADVYLLRQYKHEGFLLIVIDSLLEKYSFNVYFLEVCSCLLCFIPCCLTLIEQCYYTVEM